MRIVDRKTFLAMPAGTVFCKYAPCFFESVQIKEHTVGSNDFRSLDFAGPLGAISTEDYVDKCDAMTRGESVPVDFNDFTRDGLFDKDQLFAVWEESDIQKFIERLFNRDFPVAD